MRSGDNLQPRRRRAPFKAIPGREFRAGDVLEASQDDVLGCLAARNLPVAVPAGRKVKIVRGHRMPKALVVHGLKPGNKIINVLKVVHIIILPKIDGNNSIFG